MSKRPRVLVPATSSPSVRESQPKSPDLNDPSNGPIPGRAVFDTPPPDSQPVVLNRDQRSRVPSARKREQLISEGKLPTSTPISHTAAKDKTPSHSSQPRKSKKRAVVLSATDDDEPPRARQARNQSTKGPASPSESPARRPTVAARGSAIASSASAPVTLQPDTAATLGRLFGVDFATTSPQEFEQTIRSLSDNRTQEMASSKRYAKVRGTSPSPLPTLNKQGGYHRDRMGAFESLSENTAKRSHPLQDTKVTKRARMDPQEEMNSQDELAADPDANMTDPADFPPLPPPLFGTQLSKRTSVSSTQGAAVNAPSSRPSRPESTPTGHTGRSANIMVEASASARGLAITPVPEPRKSRPSANGQTAPSNTQQRVRAPQATTRKDPPPPHKPPNPSTATESETESEPLAPPRHSRPHANSRHTQPSKPAATQPAPPPLSSQPSDRRNNTVPPAPKQDQLMDRLKDILAGGDEDEVLNWAMHFVQKRTKGPEPGPSRSRAQPDATVDLRSRFRANARSRSPDDVRRHARYPRLPQPSPAPTPDSDHDDLPEPGEVAAAVAAVAGGANAPVALDDEGTGLGKYRDQRGKVATKAIVELLALASEKGVYQNQETCLKWALNCYRRGWKEHARHVDYEEAPNDLLRTMTLRISWLRTKVKERIRLVVRYKLGFQTPGGDNAILAENQRLFAKIFPNTFHCRSHVFDKDQYEHPALVTAICEAFFWTNDSFGVQFFKRFERVSLPAVAFVLTMMQECIEEWQTGRYQPRDLCFSRQRPVFDAHLRGLYNYVKSARDRMFRFRGAWFKAGMEHAGVTVLDQDATSSGQYRQPVTRAENVRPDTPPLDRMVPEDLVQEPEEPVPELEYDGDDEERFSAKSKGKSKAMDEEMIWGYMGYMGYKGYMDYTDL
ncbi:hypothetical protein BDV93DRAFT_514724 [Ceratobasidium sp. AG-I]|nr:hypothetical protein BDV93DRAFT_514724 [Ceratobasidium sp. AG-I]